MTAPAFLPEDPSPKVPPTPIEASVRRAVAAALRYARRGLALELERDPRFTRPLLEALAEYAHEASCYAMARVGDERGDALQLLEASPNVERVFAGDPEAIEELKALTAGDAVVEATP